MSKAIVVGASTCSTCAFKGYLWQRLTGLDFEIHVKPTSIWSPLSPSSMHMACIQRSWPAAQIMRYRQRFSSVGVSNAKAAERLGKLASCGIVVHNKYDKHCTSPKCSENVMSYIVLPSFEAFAASRVSSAISQHPMPHDICCSKVCVSWKLGGRHLVQFFKDATRSKLRS